MPTSRFTSALTSTFTVLAAAVGIASPLAAQQPLTLDVAPYRAVASRILSATAHDSTAWKRVATVTDTYGSRLSGSAALEQAIDWIVTTMRGDGFDAVRKEPVMVPHWVRGAESAELVAPRAAPIAMLGLGGSVATPAGGITAPVLVVTSFDDLHAHAADARGKIVVYDVPFDTVGEPFEIYGRVVRYRGGGASEAARVGALAALVRSVTPNSMRTPHTGALRYDTTVTRIPSAAISVEDAEMLHRMQDRGQHLVVHLTMSAQTLPDAQSNNIIAEIRGRERPDEVVVLGGHLDSWDVGAGAMDDMGGATAAWEALRILKSLGVHPRRTIRVVLWTNEENGGRGGRAYLDAHRAEVANHVLAMESDEGAFAPRGFGVNDGAMDSTTARTLAAMTTSIASLLSPIDATRVVGGGGDADIGPLVGAGVPGLSLDTDPSRYFWYHHTQADLVDKLDPRDVERCAAAMAVMAYVAAEMPGTLPRGAALPGPRRR